MENMTVRFFVDGEPNEINEGRFKSFIDDGYRVLYERHTIRENGVSQIRLTATWEGT